jgi:hypothetical protein
MLLMVHVSVECRLKCSCMSTALRLMTMSAQAAYDAKCIKNHTCPCCQITRTGQVDPRRALTAHLKRLSKTDSAHLMWCTQNYHLHFSHGGSRCIKEVTAADVIKSIKCTFGKQWSDRVSIVDD